MISLEPDRAGAHLSLGWALQEEGKLAWARQHYDTAIQLKPNHGGAYLNLGGLAEEIGDLAGAEEAFRTALKLLPTFALPHARLATLLRTTLPRQGCQNPLAHPIPGRFPKNGRGDSRTDVTLADSKRYGARASWARRRR